MMRLVLLVSEDVKIMLFLKKKRRNQLQRLYITVSTTFFFYLFYFKSWPPTASPIIFEGEGKGEDTLLVLMLRYNVDWGGSWDWRLGWGGWGVKRRAVYTVYRLSLASLPLA